MVRENASRPTPMFRRETAAPVTLE
jgi:hypothetical protein